MKLDQENGEEKSPRQAQKELAPTKQGVAAQKH